MAKTPLTLTPLQREEVAEFVLGLAKKFPETAAKYREAENFPASPPEFTTQKVYFENAYAFAKFAAYQIRRQKVAKYPPAT